MVKRHHIAAILLLTCNNKAINENYTCCVYSIYIRCKYFDFFFTLMSHPRQKMLWRCYTGGPRLSYIRNTKVEKKFQFLYYQKLAKGPFRGPAHPGGLPNDQGMKRPNYFHAREGVKINSIWYFWYIKKTYFGHKNEIK